MEDEQASKSRMARVSDNLIKRVVDYQSKMMAEQKKPISFVKASDEFAQRAVSNLDNTEEAAKRVGSKWRFKI